MKMQYRHSLASLLNRFSFRSSLFTMLVVTFSFSTLVSGTASATGFYQDKFSRLSFLANLPWRALDPDDYTVSVNDSCEYVVNSSANIIRRVVYFDASGNSIGISRDNYGNHFGQSVNLADTALAGVVESGGTLFLRAWTGWHYGFGLLGVLKITDLPVCEDNAPEPDPDACPAEVVEDPIFSEHVASSASYNVRTFGAAAQSVKCGSGNNAGQVVQVDVSFATDVNGSGVRISDPTPPDVLFFTTNEQAFSCALLLGCMADELVPLGQ